MKTSGTPEVRVWHQGTRAFDSTQEIKGTNLGRLLLVAEVGADEDERHADAEPQEAQREERAEGHRPARFLAPHQQVEAEEDDKDDAGEQQRRLQRRLLPVLPLRQHMPACWHDILCKRDMGGSSAACSVVCFQCSACGTGHPLIILPGTLSERDCSLQWGRAAPLQRQQISALPLRASGGARLATISQAWGMHSHCPAGTGLREV